MQLYHAKAEIRLVPLNWRKRIRVATLPCQSGNSASIGQKSPKKLSCNFTMPKRKHAPAAATRCPTTALQLYHAKAETDAEWKSAVGRLQVATLPCQSGNSYDTILLIAQYFVATLPCQSGNFSCMGMCIIRMLLLQLYHAKAETDEGVVGGPQIVNVATLPCQSGNPVPRFHKRGTASRCNFTMPKRKR